MTRAHVYLPNGMIAEIEGEAKRIGTYRSTLLREACRLYLNKRKKEPSNA
jgi:metal-responsive CopG/Arc/MetJ family transcriptional regulator